MSTYYRLNADGSILDFIEFEDRAKIPKFIDELYSKTERKIINLADGSFAFEDTVDIEEETRKKAKKEFNELKTAKQEAMKAERDLRQELPIQYGEKSFDYDKISLQKLNEAKDDLQGTDNKQIWICADNSLTYLTYADIMAIKKLGKDRSSNLHIQYAKLKYIIEQCTTKEEVDVITFDTDTSNIILEI